LDIATAANGVRQVTDSRDIEDRGAQLGDDDQQRSTERAHRLWWNSKLERWRLHNAMTAARYATLARVSKGQVGPRPMAYLLAVLAGAAADQCIKAGLPLPGGWSWPRPTKTTRRRCESERVD
jgi:hypothetical protein